MKTKLLDGTNAADIESARLLLEAGGLVALPTETVYGLAADASNPNAVAKIFAAKGRPSNHPLIVHISSIDDLVNWAAEIPDIAYKLAAVFWPGPLTLLLKKSDKVSDVVTGGLPTIGIRVPNNPIFLKLLELGGTAYAAPSANPYKQLSPVSAEQVMAGLAGKIDGILDGGVCAVGVESTILDLTNAPYRVLRSGPISANELEQVAGVAIVSPKTHDVAVSGNVQDHYQPKTPLYLVTGDEMPIRLEESAPNEAFVSITANGQSKQGPLFVAMPDNPEGYARLLYKTLYDLDKHKPSIIWCEMPVGVQWEYIVDRLRKASSNY